MLIASTTSETGDQCVFGAAARGLVLKRQRDVCHQRHLALARCRQQRCRSAGRAAQRGDDDISVEDKSHIPKDITFPVMCLGCTELSDRLPCS